jgi:group I intron endonuclease
MGYIYCIRHRESGKKYVGQHKGVNVQKRWNQHKKKTNDCPYIRNAIQKYGVEAFDFFIICICFDEDCDVYEVEYIKSLNTLSPIGYNLTTGGNNGIPCEETRKRMSLAQLGKKHTEESKEKMRLNNLGKKLTQETKDKIGAAHKGKKTGAETKKKMSLAQIGKKHSAETRKKISEVQKGKKVSDETKEKIRVAQTGKPLSAKAKQKISKARKGMVFSEETKQKMRKPHTETHNKNVSEAITGVAHWRCTPVIQMDLEGNFIKRFPSAAIVAREFNKGKSCSVGVSSCCRGKTKSCMGFTWKYESTITPTTAASAASPQASPDGLD